MTIRETPELEQESVRYIPGYSGTPYTKRVVTYHERQRPHRKWVEVQDPRSGAIEDIREAG